MDIEELKKIHRQLGKLIHDAEKVQEKVEHSVESEKYYKEGYTCGYEWLASGRWNFLHPHETRTYGNGFTLKGYIPGGPWFYNKYERWDDKRFKSEDTRIKLCADAWRKGWIDGINQYVTDNSLPYGKVT